MKCYSHPTIDALGTCTVCGRAVCVDCRSEVSGLLRCPAHAMPAAAVVTPSTLPPPPPTSAWPQKSAGLAFFLGLFPGAGHIYLGLYQRGLAIFGTWVLTIFLAANASDFFGFGVAFMVFFSVLDAVRMARLINAGGASEDPSQLIEQMKPGHGSIVAGVALMILGIASWLHMQFGVSFRFLSDNWPLVVVAIGAWLVWRAIRSRNASDTTAPGAADSGLSA